MPIARVVGLIGGLALVAAFYMPWFGSQGLILTGAFLDQGCPGTTPVYAVLPGAAGGPLEVQLLRALVDFSPARGARSPRWSRWAAGCGRGGVSRAMWCWASWRCSRSARWSAASPVYLQANLGSRPVADRGGRAGDSRRRWPGRRLRARAVLLQRCPSQAAGVRAHRGSDGFAPRCSLARASGCLSETNGRSPVRCGR